MRSGQQLRRLYLIYHLSAALARFFSVLPQHRDKISTTPILLPIRWEVFALRKITAAVLLVLLLMLPGCILQDKPSPFTACRVTLESSDFTLPAAANELLTAYFACRGNSFGVAEGALGPDALEALCAAEAVKDAEQQRVLRLQELRRDWKCRFSGAAVSLRLDAVRQQVDGYILNVYEYAYFYNWYPGYTSPESADLSGYGVWHVLHFAQNGGVWQITRDTYYEGRPTQAGGGGWADDPLYRAYAGEVSLPPQPITGTPPQLKDNSPKYIEQFNIQFVLDYTDRWAPSRNPVYRDYTPVGGNCANFASQALAAGGLPQDDVWYCADGQGSAAWISSTRLYRYLTETANCGKGVAVLRQKDTAGRTLSLAGKAQKAETVLLPGSPVFYRWGGGYIGDNRWSHTAICVGTLGDGTPAVNCHTGDKYHFKWNYGGRDCDYGTVQMTKCK